MNAFFFVNRNLTCFVSWIIYYRIYMATGEIVRRENAKSSLGFHETKLPQHLNGQVLLTRGNILVSNVAYSRHLLTLILAIHSLLAAPEKATYTRTVAECLPPSPHCGRIDTNSGIATSRRSNTRLRRMRHWSA